MFRSTVIGDDVILDDGKEAQRFTVVHKDRYVLGIDDGLIRLYVRTEDGSCLNSQSRIYHDTPENWKLIQNKHLQAECIEILRIITDKQVERGSTTTLTYILQHLQEMAGIPEQQGAVNAKAP